MMQIGFLCGVVTVQDDKEKLLVGVLFCAS